MGKLKYLMVHCSATPFGKKYSELFIKRCHLGPLDFKDGRVKYMGKIYKNRDALPDEKIGSKHIKDIKGRGWRQIGYSDLIYLNGVIQNLVEYDGDNWVQANEITNGAIGLNQTTRHVCFIGGLREDKEKRMSHYSEILTMDQYHSLEFYIKAQLKNHPDLLILGHNIAANKLCPGFYVHELLQFIGIPERNIIYSETQIKDK